MRRAMHQDIGLGIARVCSLELGLKSKSGVPSFEGQALAWGSGERLAPTRRSARAMGCRRSTSGREARARAAARARGRAARRDGRARPGAGRRRCARRGAVRATRQEARGQRSSAFLSFHEARWSGASAASIAASYGSSVAARPASRSRIASVASRDETKHSYIPSPDTGSSSPAASPTSSARSPARRVSRIRSGRRWPRRLSSAAGSRPCASQTRRRCSRIRGPSSCQAPTPTFAWSPFGKTQP